MIICNGTPTDAAVWTDGTGRAACGNAAEHGPHTFRRSPEDRFTAAQAALESAIRAADYIDPSEPAEDRRAIWQRVADAGAERDAALAAVRAAIR